MSPKRVWVDVFQAEWHLHIDFAVVDANLLLHVLRVNECPKARKGVRKIFSTS